MVFPFGVSISDFIEGIRLFKDAIKALSDTQGARPDYEELERSLTSLDNALKAASALVLDNPLRQQALQYNLDNCRTCVTNFLVKIASFKSLGTGKSAQGNVLSAFRKIKWAICKKEDVGRFRSEIDVHVGNMNMLLLSFQV